MSINFSWRALRLWSRSQLKEPHIKLRDFPCKNNSVTSTICVVSYIDLAVSNQSVKLVESLITFGIKKQLSFLTIMGVHLRCLQPRSRGRTWAITQQEPIWELTSWRFKHTDLGIFETGIQGLHKLKLDIIRRIRMMEIFRDGSHDCDDCFVCLVQNIQSLWTEVLNPVRNYRVW